MHAEIRKQLKVPSAALMLVGLLNCFSSMGVILVWLNGKHQEIQITGQYNDQDSWLVLVIIGLSLLSFIFSPVVMYGAFNMFAARSYTIAKAAALFAIIPTSFCFPVGTPIGIWTLLLLNRADIKAGFNAPG